MSDEPNLGVEVPFFSKKNESALSLFLNGFYFLYKGEGTFTEALAKYNNEIAFQIEEKEKRAAELEIANQELNEAKNMFSSISNALAKEKELNELKSRFVSLASHEFRTPLTTMLSSLSLITKYGEINDLANQAKHVAKIKASIDNLTSILDDFLSLSKLEEGMVLPKPEKVNLKDFIDEIVLEMRLMAAGKQQIVFSHSGKQFAFLDKKILRNILHNLISNALKFTKENGLIEVVGKSSLNFIKISVKDNGIGIPHEDQKHLLQRFFRGRNASHIQGTGLGLNIVTKYLEQMKGSLSFESEENIGTTFIIKLPQ